MVMDWNITTLWPPIAVAYRAVEREGVPRAADAVQQALDQAGRAIAILEGLLGGRDYVTGGQGGGSFGIGDIPPAIRSEEHTSELQSLMRISYAVFCLKKKKNITVTYTKVTSY